MPVVWMDGDEFRGGRIVGRCEIVERGLGNAYVADGLVVDYHWPDGTGGDLRGLYFDRATRLFRVVEVRR